MLGDSEIQDGTNAPPNYELREQLARLLWFIIANTFFRLVPRRFNGFHRFVLRLFGAKIGYGVQIYPSARIAMPWMLQIDDGAVIAKDVDLYCLGPIKIGRNTVISQRAVLCAGTHDYMDRTMPLIRSSVTIGKGCWICMEAFVCPGVSVGDGSVIGARAVVTRSISERKVCAGNPCRELKDRVFKNVYRDNNSPE